MSSTPAGPERVTPAPRRSASAAPRGAPDVHRQSLDLLIGNVADILGCEVALFCRPDAPGAARGGDQLVGPGTRTRATARRREGGFVDRALGAERAILGPLHDDHDAALISAARGLRLTHAVAAPVRLAASYGRHPDRGVLVAPRRSPIDRCGPPSRAPRWWRCACTSRTC